MGNIVGVDEVGRGCLAGPLLVVAARAKTELPPGLKDSKLLSRKQRLELLNLLSNCCDFGEGWVESNEIDKHGLAGGLRLGAARALRNLDARIDEEIIMDGSVNYIPKKFKFAKTMVKADSCIPIVSAASIYAKVKRDHFMIKLAESYPAYNFDEHVGYGTDAHLRALKAYGLITNVHRLSFAPIAKLVARA